MFDNEVQEYSCYSFFHNIGFLILNSKTGSICIDPSFLAKAMACFVYYPEHDRVLFGFTEGIHYKSIAYAKLLEQSLLLMKFTRDFRVRFQKEK